MISDFPCDFRTRRAWRLPLEFYDEATIHYLFDAARLAYELTGSFSPERSARNNVVHGECEQWARSREARPFSLWPDTSPSRCS